MAATKSLVLINIVSDVACPFCYIGKKRMEASMRKLQDRMEFRVQWLPYQVRPDAPPEGMPVPSQFVDSALLERMRKIGQEVGVDLKHGHTSLPNTTLAHALMQFASARDDGRKQSDIAELLFKAHFTEGRPLTEQTVVGVGEEVGYEGGQVRAYLRDEGNLEAVRQACRQNEIKAQGGVPMFYFNGQRMFSGAQSEEVFTRMLTIAAERFPLEQSKI